MDKLFSEKDIMKLNEKQSVSPMEAILTADGEVTERLVFFKRASEALWNGSILTASDRLASIYNIKKPDDIQQRFAQRYGWEIITADGGELPEYAMRNIVLAYFMEWMMTRYDAGLSDAENMSEFLFRAQALMLATKGAAALCTDRTQLLCSISDFIAAL